MLTGYTANAMGVSGLAYTGRQVFVSWVEQVKFGYSLNDTSVEHTSSTTP